jgi:hypothetical protein
MNISVRRRLYFPQISRISQIVVAVFVRRGFLRRIDLHRKSQQAATKRIRQFTGKTVFDFGVHLDSLC